MLRIEPKNGKKDTGMREEDEQSKKPALTAVRGTDHPWVEMPAEDGDTLDETLRYSLDEIRFA